MRSPVPAPRPEDVAPPGLKESALPADRDHVGTRTWAGRLAVSTAVVAAAVAVAAAPASAQPAPSDGQVGTAQQAADAVAAQVGQVLAQQATARRP